MRCVLFYTQRWIVLEKYSESYSMCARPVPSERAIESKHRLKYFQRECGPIEFMNCI